MPRTPDDIAYTDKVAAECGYVAPPAVLEPTKPIYEDPRWSQLADWFAEHTASFDNAILVYISRRWDTPIQQAYMIADSWMKGQHQRRDIESDPEARNSYGN